MYAIQAESMSVFTLTLDFWVFSQNGKEKESKGAWRMPWLTEAMKDVISCDKPRVGANIL